MHRWLRLIARWCSGRRQSLAENATTTAQLNWPSLRRLAQTCNDLISTSQTSHVHAANWRLTLQRIMSRHIVHECYCVLHLFGFNYFMSVRHRWAPVRSPYQVYHDDNYDKCKKNKVYKNGYRRRSCTSKTAKIHRFVRFVMYCFITTVPVAFYCACSDEIVNQLVMCRLTATNVYFINVLL